VRDRTGNRMPLNRAVGQPSSSAILEDQRHLQGVRDRYLSDPKEPEAFEGRDVGVPGAEDTHRSEDPSSYDEHCMIFIRGARGR